MLFNSIVICTLLGFAIAVPYHGYGYDHDHRVGGFGDHQGHYHGHWHGHGSDEMSSDESFEGHGHYGEYCHKEHKTTTSSTTSTTTTEAAVVIEEAAQNATVQRGDEEQVELGAGKTVEEGGGEFTVEDGGNVVVVQEANPRLTAPCGTFEGSWMQSRKGRKFEAYRGIRYAEAPVGELRFEPPRPIHKYKEEVNASTEGPACPTFASEYYYENFSEDCLRLNVYTPAVVKNASLPVIVFIHAGGFYSMSGRSDLAGPHYLLDRDMVLVTINYRLGSLGFLSTGDEVAPGNNGLKDQVVALHWIKKNIAAFGGNPDLITLTGCSAGSISVMLHMISPMSKGLFHRGIALSGSPISKVSSLRHERHLAIKQAQLLNCPTNSSRAIVDCLRKRTWREIGDSLLGFFQYSFDPVGIWLPVVELDFGQERFLDIEPAIAIEHGHMKAVPCIISQTQDEFYWKAFGILRNATLLTTFNTNWNQVAPISFMLPQDRENTLASERLREAYLHGKPLQDDKASADALGSLYGDAIIGFSVHRLANIMARCSSEKVFYAEFSYVGEHSHYEDPVTEKPIGAMHHDELIYLFSLSYRFPLIAPGSPDSAFVDTMTALWYNFARYGDPNPRGDLPELASLHWPAMTPTDRKYVRIDQKFTIHSGLFEDRFRVWEGLYPEHDFWRHDSDSLEEYWFN